MSVTALQYERDSVLVELSTWAELKKLGSAVYDESAHKRLQRKYRELAEAEVNALNV